mmetsp:Transcript_8091/g.16770  ORF Transcript_8091/g.16770 Transcript_8091/m.16770 type:complete len:125 (+) Transcript_8091:60-434(+)
MTVVQSIALRGDAASTMAQEINEFASRYDRSSYDVDGNSRIVQSVDNTRGNKASSNSSSDGIPNPKRRSISTNSKTCDSRSKKPPDATYSVDMSGGMFDSDDSDLGRTDKSDVEEAKDTVTTRS